MVPITTSVAVQGGTTSNAFNNTIRAMAYNDKQYHSPWQTQTTAWTQSPWMREGQNTDINGTLGRNVLPKANFEINTLGETLVLLKCIHEITNPSWGTV